MNSIFFLKISKILVLIISTVIIVLFFYSYFFSYGQLELPEGCDNFGYLNIAKSISEGKILKGTTQRPFYAGLIEYLKSKYPLDSYSGLISPHAHYVNERTFKIVNQYPIGVGLILSPIPIYERRVYYPVICVLFIIIALLFAFKLSRTKTTLFETCLLVIVIGVLLQEPFKAFFYPVHSCPSTYGIIIAAGYLLDKRPNVSLFLVGLASIFRISNVLFIIPCTLVYFMKDQKLKDSKSSQWGVFVRMLKKFASALGCFYLGYFPQSIYTWFLLGTPFSSTYGSNDLKSLSSNNLEHHLSFYLSHKVFIFHLIILILIGLLSLGRSCKWFFISLFIFFLNYSIIIFHQNSEPYYPYGSAMLLVGVFLFLFQDRFRIDDPKVFFRKFCLDVIEFIDGNVKGLRKLIKPIILLVISLFVFIYAGFILFNLSSKIKIQNIDHKQVFLNQIRFYENCFESDDVVWAEMKSGTVEYATSKAGFRYQRGRPEVRKDIMLWLYAHHYNQAILAEDVLLKKHDIKKDLDKINIPYNIKTCEGIEKGKSSLVYELRSQKGQ